MTDKKLPSSDSKRFQAWEGSSVFVEQGRHWSSAFIWLSAGLFVSGLVFAFTAKIDQTISVRGQLSPAGSVRDVDSPSGGVILDVFVKDGEYVNTGDNLLIVESKGLSGRRLATIDRLLLLSLEIQAFQFIIDNDGDIDASYVFTPLDVSQYPRIADKLPAARNQSKQVLSQLRQLSIRLDSRSESLRLQQQMADDLKPLYDSGGLSRNNYLVQLNKLQELKAEISSLKSEKTRLIGLTTSKVNQLNREEIALKAELEVLNEQLSYRTIKAPVSGTVFNVVVSRHSVVSNSEVLLSIVPEKRLQADIAILNMDIGFVQTGQSVSVSVDSFPSGEFGYIEGTLTSIGSDALPPDRKSPQRYFPAIISLNQQIAESGSKLLNLQSGMSVTANIKLRSRPAITILTDIFTRQMDGIKRFR